MVILHYGLENSEYLPQSAKENVLYGIYFLKWFLFYLNCAEKVKWLLTETDLFFFFQLKKNYNITEKHLKSYCYSANYVYTILADGYKFNAGNWEKLDFQKEVRLLHIKHNHPLSLNALSWSRSRWILCPGALGLAALILIINNYFNSDLRV